MSHFRKVELRDICDRVDYGYTASATAQRIGPKFLRITDIVPELIDWERVPYCLIDKKKHDRYRLTKGDIVIARTGATSGWAKRIRRDVDAVFASYLVRLRINRENDAEFVGAVVESSLYKQFIQANLSGAAQPQANAQVLTSFPIPLPPLPTQRKIASILSAYDDLIENNTRRIAILEEMAQSLYREWFVHYRYPGHEHVPLVDSPIGPVPEGWEVVELSQLTTLRRTNITPSKYSNELFDHYSLPAYDEGELPVREAGGLIRSNKYLIEPGVVLLSKLNPRIPRVWNPCLDSSVRSVASTEFIAMLPEHGLSSTYLYYLLQGEPFQRDYVGRAIGTSTSHQRVKPQDVVQTDVLRPTASIHDAFVDSVEPLDAQVNSLRSKNISLRRTRDLLLPRLISGEVQAW